MSSAKSIGFIIYETCSMSFIYKMKSNGPNIDPCGTPQEISLYSDSVLDYVLFPILEIAYRGKAQMYCNYRFPTKTMF